MTHIRFRCPSCNRKLAVPRRKAGARIDCPSCGDAVTVPQETESPPTEGIVGKDVSQTSRASQWFHPQAPEAPAPPPAPPGAPVAQHAGQAALADDEEAFTIRPAKTQLEEMDLTPMVDVTFQLLIFFMVTLSISMQKTIRFPAPDPSDKGAVQTPDQIDKILDESIEVRIDERNNITIDDQPVADPTRLSEILLDKSRTETKTELIVMPHERAEVQVVVNVFDAAQKAGIQRLRMTAVGAE